MSKFQEILDGWQNDALKRFDLLSPEVKKIGEIRSKICGECDWSIKSTEISGNRSALMRAMPGQFFCDANQSEMQNGVLVNGCGCAVNKKVLSPLSACPRNRWKPERKKHRLERFISISYYKRNIIKAGKFFLKFH